MSLLPWLILAGISVMLFDAPGSTGSFFTLLVFISIWAHPLAAIAGAFIIFGNERNEPRRYVRGMLITIVPVVFALVSFAAIGSFCGGRLAC
jgi:hypothetical protein